MAKLDAPECGFWKVRLRRDGPYVAASIQLERLEHEPGEPTNALDRGAIMTARLNGDLATLAEVWERRRDPIDKATHDFMVADAAWAAQHSPEEAIASPRRPIDWMQARLPF